MMIWIESLAGDLGYGLRLLRRRAGLAVLCVVTLALGIGANAAIFTLLNAILLRPLPYAEPERLVGVLDRFPQIGVAGTLPTIPEILDIREHARTLTGIAFFDTRDFRITGGDEPVRVLAARVSASLFPTLGVRPALGRVFVDGDNLEGHWNVVVLSDGLWRRNFGSDPAVIGRTLSVNGTAHSVVGVLPRGFSVEYPGISTGEPIDMYVPFQMSSIYTSRSAEFVNVRRVSTIARLAGGATREQASAELQAIADSLAVEHPDLYRRAGQPIGFRLDVERLQDIVTRGARSVLVFLFGAVVLVLIIACVNTGQFLLAQSLDREAEVAVRVSLGAGRARLFRQFLVESSVLAVAGGALGVVLAIWLVDVLVALLPGRRPELDAIAIDPTVLAFAAAISVLSALLVGVLPALYFSRADPAQRFAARGGASAGSRSRHLLVAVEVAVAVVLLASAGLLIQGVWRLQTADRGFSSDDVTVMQIRGTGSQAIKPIASTVYQHYVERLAAMPGVESAAATTGIPLRGAGFNDFSIEGQPLDAAATARQRASYQIVSADYFRIFRIALREGRVIANEDEVDRPAVAVVNELLARRHWPGESAIGRAIRVGSRTLTIVGVVADVRTVPLDITPVPQIYVSNLQQYEPNMNLVVRSVPGSAVTADAIKKAIWSVTPDLPVFNLQPMSTVVRGSLAEQRFIAMLLGGFAALALLMSATGVYTVVAYLVARRTREIAVRLAIGAQPRDIVRLVSGQTFRWSGAGLVAGVIATVALRGVAQSALRGVAQPDAGALTVLVLFYLFVTGCAVAVPVARALRVLDPAAALRAD